MFRAFKCTSSGENHCIYATLVSVTLDVWRLVGRLDWKPNRRHPYRVTDISIA